MPQKLVYALIVVFVTSFALAVANVLYTNHVNGQAEHRNQQRAREICGLIVVLDDAYRQNPPTTELGRHIAAEMHTYRVGLGC